MPDSYIDCPICGKRVALADALSPFCSPRCRLLDLGNWASGRYAIPSAFPENASAEDDDSALGPGENND